MQGSGGFLNTNQHAGPPHYTIEATTESRTKKMRNATFLKKIILRKQDHRILYDKEREAVCTSLDDKRKIENEDSRRPLNRSKKKLRICPLILFLCASTLLANHLHEPLIPSCRPSPVFAEAPWICQLWPSGSAWRFKPSEIFAKIMQAASIRGANTSMV